MGTGCSLDTGEHPGIIKQTKKQKKAAPMLIHWPGCSLGLGEHPVLTVWRRSGDTVKASRQQLADWKDKFKIVSRFIKADGNVITG